MPTTTEEQIRLRAYALWEEDGRPEGQHNVHWERAYRELVASETKPIVKPASRKSPVKKAASAPADAEKPARKKKAAAATSGTKRPKAPTGA